jgi:hypothetical protein
MANLSGQTIQSTYPGLLNLNTATTGITSTPQAITDGLGNDTGLNIATNYLAAPNLLNYYSEFVPDYGGVGFGVGSATNPANSNNRLIYSAFWDSGVNAYSALTYNLQTLTTTNDTVTFSLYTAQMVDGIGIAPKDLILSGVSMTTTGTTGVKKTNLVSDVSFSGYSGGGYYIYGYVITSTAATPTIRFTTRNTTVGSYSNFDSMGFFLTSAGTSLVPASKTQLQVNAGVLNTVQASYSKSDIQNQWVATNAINWGFGLNTVK